MSRGASQALNTSSTHQSAPFLHVLNRLTAPDSPTPTHHLLLRLLLVRIFVCLSWPDSQAYTYPHTDALAHAHIKHKIHKITLMKINKLTFSTPVSSQVHFLLRSCVKVRKCICTYNIPGIFIFSLLSYFVAFPACFASFERIWLA